MNIINIEKNASTDPYILVILWHGSHQVEDKDGKPRTKFASSDTGDIRPGIVFGVEMAGSPGRGPGAPEHPTFGPLPSPPLKF